MQEQVKVTTWALWQGRPKDTHPTKAIETILRKFARTTAHQVWVPREPLQAMLTKIHHSINMHELPIGTLDRVLIPTNFLTEALHRYDMWDVQNSNFYRNHQSHLSTHGVTPADTIYAQQAENPITQGCRCSHGPRE